MPQTHKLSESAIWRGLRTRLMGQKICAYAEVASTNDVAAELAFQGAPEGTLVVAEAQTKGRGRGGTIWHSPRALGIWASLVLRPDPQQTDTLQITFLLGNAIADAVRRVTGLEPSVKWPNDVLIGGKKVCGILAETRSGKDGLRHVVAGFGVNVLQTQKHFPEHLRSIATSLYLATGRKYSRIVLLQEILRQIERRWMQAGSGNGFALLNSDLCGSQSTICNGAVDDSGGGHRQHQRTLGIV